MAESKPQDNKPTPPMGVAPTPPDAPKAKARESKPMPLQMQDVLGTPQEQVYRNWNKQAKDGIIFQCTETDGDLKCGHPLSPVRDANNQPVVFHAKYKGKNGKELTKTEFVLTCTYHPEHGKSITLPSNLVVLKEGQRISSLVGFKQIAPSRDGDDADMT